VGAVLVLLVVLLKQHDHRTGIGRRVLGRELATIADYRLRLNQYRTDVGLLAAHEAGPWIPVWLAPFQLSLSFSR
jgi:phosphodiesterase/alkaline phosphatase D-like protein